MKTERRYWFDITNQAGVVIHTSQWAETLTNAWRGVLSQWINADMKPVKIELVKHSVV